MNWYRIRMRIAALIAAISLLACGGGGGGAPGDQLAPVVSSVSPLDQATISPGSSTVAVTFSEAIDCSKVNASALAVTEGATAVPGTVSCSGNTLSFTAAAGLPTDATLSAKVDASIADLAGNRLASTYSWAFRVRPWTVQTGTSSADSVGAVAVDASGNLYLVGASAGSLDGGPSAGLFDAVLIMYDRFGTKQWSRQFGSAADETALAVAVDGAGNVYVGGVSDGHIDGATPNSASGAFVAKFDSAGSRRWIRQISSGQYEVVRSLAVDAAGDVVAAGYTTGDLFAPYAGGGADLYVLKLDGDGNLKWGRQFGTSRTDNASGVAVDAQRNVFVVGYTFGGGANAGSADVLVAKYDANGVSQWMQQFGTADLDVASGVAIGPGGSLYVVGRTEGSFAGETNAGGQDAFVARLDTSGHLAWLRLIGSGADEMARGLAVDATGNVMVVGETTGTLTGAASAGASDGFLAKFDQSGTRLWLRQFGTSGNETVTSVGVDGGGNAFVAGQTPGSFDGKTNLGDSDLFLLKFAPDGTKR